MKKILYVGEKDEYVTNLKSEIQKYLKDCELVSESHVTTESCYEAIDKHQPSIILLSFEAQEILTRRFFIKIQKAFGKIPFVVLAALKEQVVKVEKISTLGDYIYWIKNPTTDDIISYISKKLRIPSLLDVKYKKAFYKDDFDLFQCMRVAQMNRTHAQIETNRFFENDTIIPMQFPYHGLLFNSDRHKITKRTTDAIESHFRYRYSLEYILHTKKMELSERSKLIKNYRYEISTKPVNENIYLSIIEATKEKKFSVLAEANDSNNSATDENAQTLQEIDLLSRTLYFNWLLEENEGLITYNDTITIYDRQLHLMKKGLAEIESESVNVIHRKEIVNHQKNMLMDMPSLIVVYLDEYNNLARVKEMISGVTLLKDHFPYIAIFNYQGNLSADDLRHSLEYHFVLSSSEKPDPYLIVRMLQIYRSKKRDKEITKGQKRLEALRATNPKFFVFENDLLFDYKVYKQIDDPDSLIMNSLPAKVLWLSETEIMFRTSAEFEIGDIFRIRKPFDLQIEILEKLEDEKEYATARYIAHLHFVSETDRMTLKGFVEELSALNDQNVKLNSEELQLLQDRYFPFNFVYEL